jgi:hypothetical protein
MTKTKEQEEPRKAGPKFGRSVIPDSFQIRRPASPMADLLDEARRESLAEIDGAAEEATPVGTAPVMSTPVKPTPVVSTLVPSTPVGPTAADSTPVLSTPVLSTPVRTARVAPSQVISTGVLPQVPPVPLPDLDSFLDSVLPRFPPARQTILLRIYRWSGGQERDVVVSTPRLAAKTNMDEKSCRSHLHALIADGYLVRIMDGEHHARFGGHDRTARGLILRLSASALSDLTDQR